MKRKRIRAELDATAPLRKPVSEAEQAALDPIRVVEAVSSDNSDREEER
jgi:hypothetical protein